MAGIIFLLIITIFFFFIYLLYSKKVKTKSLKNIVLIAIPILFFLVSFVIYIFDTDTVNLGNGYIYDKNHKMISSSKGNYGEVPSNVLEYRYDKDFIVASQIPRELDPNIMLYDKEYNYIQGYQTIYYWIIIKKNNEVLGPLTISEFMEIKEENHVSDELIQDLKTNQKP